MEKEVPDRGEEEEKEKMSISDEASLVKIVGFQNHKIWNNFQSPLGCLIHV